MNPPSQKKHRRLTMVTRILSHTNNFVLSLTQNRRLLCLVVSQSAVHPMIPGAAGVDNLISTLPATSPRIHHHTSPHKKKKKGGK
jgi:hypothetical protein